MIIFLYGKDTYRMKEKLKEIVEKYKKVHKSGLSLKYFDAEKDNIKSLKDDLDQISIFKEKKLIVIYSPFSNENLKNFVDSENIAIFYQGGEVKKTEPLFKFLEKNAKCQKFDPLTGQKLKSWIQKEVSGRGSKIDIDAQDLLVKYIGSDLWRMHNEINKLANYKGGQTIEVKDVELLVKTNIETDIFKTVDAIAQRNKKQALSLIQKHIEKGDSPVYLLYMISYQFRNLLIVKDFYEKQVPFNIIAKKSGLHPFVAQKTYFQSLQFSFSAIRKIYKKIFETDFKIKTGQMEPETGLELLIISC
jgi:DNA polymerase III subunit delta